MKLHQVCKVQLHNLRPQLHFANLMRLQTEGLQLLCLLNPCPGDADVKATLHQFQRYF